MQLIAVLLLTEESVSSYLKAGLRVKSAHSTYQSLLKRFNPGNDAYHTIDDTTPLKRWLDIDTYRDAVQSCDEAKDATTHLQVLSQILMTPQSPFHARHATGERNEIDRAVLGGISFGVGTFTSMLANLPRSFLRMLAKFGFHGDAEHGHHLLCLGMLSDSPRSCLSALQIITVQAILPSFFQLQQSQLRSALILDDIWTWHQKLYPRCSLFLWMKGRFLRSRTLLASSPPVAPDNDFFAKLSIAARNAGESPLRALEASSASAPNWRQLEHLVLYDAAISHLFHSSPGNLLIAASKFLHLAQNNKWSPCFMLYAALACLSERNLSLRVQPLWNRLVTQLQHPYTQSSPSCKLWTLLPDAKSLMLSSIVLQGDRAIRTAIEQPNSIVSDAELNQLCDSLNTPQATLEAAIDASLLERFNQQCRQLFDAASRESRSFGGRQFAIDAYTTVRLPLLDHALPFACATELNQVFSGFSQLTWPTLAWVVLPRIEYVCASTFAAMSERQRSATTQWLESSTSDSRAPLYSTSQHANRLISRLSALGSEISPVPSSQTKPNELAHSTNFARHLLLLGSALRHLAQVLVPSEPMKSIGEQCRDEAELVLSHLSDDQQKTLKFDDTTDAHIIPSARFELAALYLQHLQPKTHITDLKQLNQQSLGYVSTPANRELAIRAQQLLNGASKSSGSSFHLKNRLALRLHLAHMDLHRWGLADGDLSQADDDDIGDEDEVAEESASHQ